MELKFYLQRILRRRVDLVLIDALRLELRASILREAVDV
jgi:predicted nucleotidyltransferase